MIATMQTACRHCAPGCCVSPFLTQDDVKVILRVISKEADFFPLQSALIEVVRKLEVGENERAQVSQFLTDYAKDADPVFLAAYTKMADLVMQCTFED